MKTQLAISLVAAALLAPTAFANDGHDGHHDMAAAPAAAAVKLVDGTVKKVDLSGKKLTLSHGPLENLGMPGMTMSFPVKDPAWLTAVKTGDKVRFVADMVDGTITIVRLESSR